MKSKHYDSEMTLDEDLTIIDSYDDAEHKKTTATKSGDNFFQFIVDLKIIN